jgi:nicotinic acetylcholine receptor
VTSPPAITSHVPSPEGNLVAHLLSSYSAKGRPVSNVTKPVEVKVGLSLQQILEVDPVRGTMTSLVWPSLEWTDEFLTWKDSVSKIHSISMNVGDIWLPDIEFYNQVGRTSQRERDQVVLTESGSITWIPAFLVTTTCSNITDMAKVEDSTFCEIKMGSWTHNGLEINLTMVSNHVDVSNYAPNKLWNLKSTQAKRNKVFYDCCPEPYIDVTFTLELTRRKSLSIP